MAETVKVAGVQMSSGPDIAENLKAVANYIREAAAQGARFIATPENTDLICHPPSEKPKVALPEEAHPGLPFFSDLAQELGVTLLVGSMAIKLPSGKLANRSFLFSENGELAATYDKVHMFDVDLPTGESHRESTNNEPGEKLVLHDAGFAKIGLSICYDLRFAYLYRALAQGGAQILTIPSAFTVPTGQAHWETLLRARAIEAGSFVLAPAQTGTHQGGRKTWGHSMIIGPWGNILAQMQADPGIITADLNLDEVEKARSAIPALKHDRLVKLS